MEVPPGESVLPRIEREWMKILLVKLNHIGDTLLMTPAIRFLRERFPDCTLDVVVRRGCESVLEGNEDISRVIPIAGTDSRNRSSSGAIADLTAVMKILFSSRYDYAFDLSNSDRAKFLVLLSRARCRSINDWGTQLGVKKLVFNRVTHFEWSREHMALKDFRAVADLIDPEAQPGGLCIDQNIDTRYLVKRLPFLAAMRKYVVIHPVSRWAFKEWLPERWMEIADWLADSTGCEVVFSCGPDKREREYIKQIIRGTSRRHYSTEGMATLREMSHITGKAVLFIGVDTVAMHIAAAVQTPIVALFGPSSEWSWRPWKCRHELVLGECSCKVTRQFICDKSKPFPCMEMISVATVQGAVRRMLP